MNDLLQEGKLQDAANTAFTFLVYHPDHEITRRNLEYYLTFPDVAEEKVVDLEAAPFVKMYVRGVQAYEDENYKEAVDEFENSLESYMESEEQCRIYCEGPFDQGWYPEFTSSVASKTRDSCLVIFNKNIQYRRLLLILHHFLSDHFAFCLKCKRGCSLGLNSVNGEFRSNLLISHYNYLQFAYYKCK